MSATPRPLPLAGSLALHGLVLGWLAWGSPWAPAQKPASLYAQVIAPNYPKLVWYTFREKLPDISPTEPHGMSLPPEALERTRSQQIVSRAPALSRARQMVWDPAPKLELKQDLRLPNLLALQPAHPLPAPPPKPKLFVPAPERPRPVEKPAALEAPPGIVADNTLPDPLRPEIARPEPRQFVLPDKKPAAEPSPELASPPKLAMSMRVAGSGLPGSMIPGPAKPQPRAFVPPPEALAPHAAVPGGDPGAGLPETPRLSASAVPTNVQKVVVGLSPAERLEVPPPEGSRRAAFSAGPEVRTQGGDGQPSAGARITVPDLLVRGGGAAPGRPLLIARSPSSPANLAAAARMAAQSVPPAGATATQNEPPPDPSFAGRAFYRLAIQMPNVTSYSGSWTIWLAERDIPTGVPAALHLPEPLHKVDPKYYPSAMDDRVEGRVRLRGVLTADGRVVDIAVLEKLDDRLDSSSVDALRRWEFSPANRNGTPVAVDMVVEIPFRLRPEKGK